MFWFYTALSTILTFITIYLGRRRLSKLILRIGKYHIHHSVNGVVLMIAGLIHFDIFKNPVTAIGLGIYISHVLEEMVFGKKKFRQAVRIFVTLIVLESQLPGSNT